MKELVEYIESLLGTDGITFQSQLKQVGHDLMGDAFGGVYASNQSRPKNKHCVVNTDKLGGPGKHWFCVCPNGYVYDSLKKNGRHKDKEQADSEQNCGARAIAFCVYHWLDSESAELV
jgi:hypothetical protein